LREALGVTRVARVTGLDRTGVEVACAVRPGGHVLQVTNGKGLDFAAAERGAISEAAELWAAERSDEPPAAFGAPAEVAAPGVAVLGLGAGPARIAWSAGTDLFTGALALVPWAAVRCTPATGPVVGGCGDAGPRWTTNGMGAAPRWEDALRHALLEAVERHELAGAFGGGFTARDLRARLLAPEAIARAAPRAAALAARIAARRFRVFFVDGSDRLGVPVAGALLFDADEGPVPLAAGYACRLDPGEALVAALLEAAQSRATDVHGARDDVAPLDPAAAAALRAACERARPTRDVPRPVREERGGAVPPLLRRLRAAGFRNAAALDLAPAGFPLRVAKVVLPGARLSGLLL
jgi:ribosomal protein S12 methylthiotransferase accessory factor